MKTISSHGCQDGLVLASWVYLNTGPCMCGQPDDELTMHVPANGCDTLPCAMCTFEGEQGAAPTA